MLAHKKLIDDYISWLKNHMSVDQVDDYVEITTPFLDRYNDSIQFYVKLTNDGEYFITDGGETIGDLIFSGIDITDRRLDIINSIINRYGIKMSPDYELYVNATSMNYPMKKHFLIQAILSINDMFMLTKSNIVNLFYEEVEKFLLDNNINNVPSVSFVGKSGFTHNFDFVIARTKNKPERLIKVVNKANKDSTTSILFSWSDISSTRKPNTVLYVFLNDIDNKISPDIYQAFNEYNITPVPWSQREQYKEQLIA